MKAHCYQCGEPRCHCNPDPAVEIDRLRAEVAALREAFTDTEQDARRYRRMRSTTHWPAAWIETRGPVLDAAVDAVPEVGTRTLVVNAP